MFLDIVNDPEVHHNAVELLGDIYNEFRDSSKACDWYKFVYKHNESCLSLVYDPESKRNRKMEQFYLKS